MDKAQAYPCPCPFAAGAEKKGCQIAAHTGHETLTVFNGVKVVSHLQQRPDHIVKLRKQSAAS